MDGKLWPLVEAGAPRSLKSGCDFTYETRGGSLRQFPFELKHSIIMASNLPNLRRLFVEARSDAEESAYSRNAFYNLVLFMSSVALFSLAAQKMHSQK
ncbi:hypothetical protein Q7P37_006496 [Cladosporium fusiforme]